MYATPDNSSVARPGRENSAILKSFLMTALSKLRPEFGFLPDLQ
jgi:hypothetical protein